MEVAFITGCGRSGTTILENMLSCHPKIAEWYEPYYLWERYFSVKENDIWEEKQLTGHVERALHREFHIFSKKAKKPIVLDKSPYHAFNLRIINRIFPHAKWIHILRDGRDVCLSMHKEWVKRSHIVKKRDFPGMFYTAFRMLKRQPFVRYKLMAILYEVKSVASFNPLKYLNKSRWNGIMGYGPRFEGWQDYLGNHSPLEFSAMQWVKSIEAVRKDWALLPEENRTEVRYEDLLTFPEDILRDILKMLGVDFSPDYFHLIASIKRNNTDKWGKAFTDRQIKMIRPILTPLIDELGYAKPHEWQTSI